MSEMLVDNWPQVQELHVSVVKQKDECVGLELRGGWDWTVSWRISPSWSAKH